MIEIAAKLLAEIRGMRQEQHETNQRLKRFDERTEQNTATVGELRLSVIKLADELKEFVDYGRRIQRLEDKVFTS